MNERDIIKMHNHIYGCDLCQEMMNVPEIHIQGYAGIILAAHYDLYVWQIPTGATTK